MNALDELVASGASLEQFFTPAYVAQAKAYAEPLRVRWVVDLGLFFASYAVIFGLGLHARLYRRCEALAARIQVPPQIRAAFERVWKGPGFGTALLFVLAMGVVLQVLSMPESIYFNFFRERREGLSHYTAAGFAYDLLKGDLMQVLAPMLLLVPLYALMRWLPRSWALILGLIGGAALITLGGLLDPLEQQVMVDFKPLPAGPVRDAVVETLNKGHVQFQDVVVENTSRTSARANAYFAGRGPTRVIVLGDTLLESFTPSEIAAAVGHEMGHVSEAVWPRRIASGVALLLAMLLLDAMLKAVARRGWFQLAGPQDIRGYLLLFFAFELASILVSPLSAASTRAKENDADAYALALTRDPQSFIGLMSKLTAQNRADPVPPGWWESATWDHPASTRRIARALRFAHDEGLPISLASPQDARPLPEH